jgi:hypothetical protein
MRLPEPGLVFSDHYPPMRHCGHFVSTRLPSLFWLRSGPAVIIPPDIRSRGDDISLTDAALDHAENSAGYFRYPCCWP